MFVEEEFLSDAGGATGSGGGARGGGNGGISNILGYASDGGMVPEAYKVKITSYRSHTSVIGLMQDSVQLKVASVWTPIVPAGIFAAANAMAQVATGGKTSIVTRATTRRMWSGTSPLIMSLRLKFEAVNDAKREVVEPCRVLQALALPSEPSVDPDNPDSRGILLGPPGPTPYLLNGLVEYKGKNTLLKGVTEYFSRSKNGEYIIVELGNLVAFWNVIVSSVAVSFPPKFTREGFPISADVNIVFETYEMPTMESLSLAYDRARVSNGGE